MDRTTFRIPPVEILEPSLIIPTNGRTGTQRYYAERAASMPIERYSNHGDHLTLGINLHSVNVSTTYN